MTTTVYCWLAKCLALDPGSALIVMNSTQDARDKAAETWRPMWEDSPRLKQFLPANRRREWTKLYQLINKSPVYWMGANSPGRLASKPIRRLILDEVDKYPRKFGGDKERREAGAAALAEQRTKTFRQTGLAKIVVFSSPTTEHGEVSKRYDTGDRRHLWVKCHACGVSQVMVWQSFRVDMKLAKTDPAAAVSGAHYECPHCHAEWSDIHRWAAIDAGEWRPTVQAQDPRCRSFWLPSWCSKMVTHSYLAAQWIKAQEGVGWLQDFINSECGEPFVHFDTRIKDDQFAQIEGDYAEGEKWMDAPAYKRESDSMVLGGVDVQKGYLVAVFRQFDADGNSGLTWSGDVANFDALDELAARFDARWVFCDQRYRTREVQEFCVAHPGYIPSMGQGFRARSLFSSQVVDVDEGRRSGGSGRRIEVVTFDPDMLKDILAATIQRTEGFPDWRVPRGYSTNEKYSRQMTAERNVNGRWMNPRNLPNHYWDAECLVLLCAIRVGFFKTIPSKGDAKNDN